MLHCFVVVVVVAVVAFAAAAATAVLRPLCIPWRKSRGYFLLNGKLEHDK